jgi:benzoate 4-monooxygenase
MELFQDHVPGSFEADAERVRGAGLELLRITSFAEIHQILRLPAFAMAKHPRTSVLQGDSVIWLDGEAHARRRRMESELFKPARLKAIERSTVEALQGHLVALGSSSGGDRVKADLFELIRVSVMAITAKLAGFDQVVDYAAADRLRRLTERMVEGIQAQWAAGSLDERIADALAARDEWKKTYYIPSLHRREELVAEHLAGRRPQEQLPSDLLTLMLLHPEEWTSPEVMEHEATIFSTGSGSTTTQATCHTVSELAGWLTGHPEDAALLDDADFLRKASTEALRLHPPAPALTRRAGTQVTLRSGRTIEAGERVYLDVAAGNRDPEVFGADADRFDPNRLLPFTRSYGFTFGGGPHLCPGLQLTVGSPVSSTGDQDPVAGTLVGILRLLYRAGVELDPDDMPELDPLTTRGTYRRFPAVFAKLDQLEAST